MDKNHPDFLMYLFPNLILPNRNYATNDSTRFLSVTVHSRLEILCSFANFFYKGIHAIESKVI